MAIASQTLREVTGMGFDYAGLKNSALIMVDCQNTYRRGVMQLTTLPGTATRVGAGPDFCRPRS